MNKLILLHDSNDMNSKPEDGSFYPLEPLTNKKLKSKTNLWYHRKPHKRASTLMDVLNRENAQLRRKEWEKMHASEFPEFVAGDALEVGNAYTEAKRSVVSFWYRLHSRGVCRVRVCP